MEDPGDFISALDVFCSIGLPPHVADEGASAEEKSLGEPSALVVAPSAADESDRDDVSQQLDELAEVRSAGGPSALVAARSCEELVVHDADAIAQRRRRIARHVASLLRAEEKETGVQILGCKGKLLRRGPSRAMAFAAPAGRSEEQHYALTAVMRECKMRKHLKKVKDSRFATMGPTRL